MEKNSHIKVTRKIFSPERIAINDAILGAGEGIRTSIVLLLYTLSKCAEKNKV